MKNNNQTWRYTALIFLALFLIANTLSFSHDREKVLFSDAVAGGAVIILSVWALYRPKKWIDWAIALSGAYLLLAPVILWAKNPVNYLNDTLIGIAIFTCAILFSPEESPTAEGDGIPTGWSFNPSAFGQRMPVITLAFFAYLFSRYMAFYQLSYTQEVIDPVFNDGTLHVITSDISKSFPVSDAGLGSWVYLIEVLMGIHGSKRRWHTIPWFVSLFALLVIPAGLVSVVLITLQPLVVGAYCFWCLITALTMLFMIALASDEVVATLLFLQSVKRRGGNVKKAFWHGDPYYETQEASLKHDSSLTRTFYGVSFPWTLILSACIGFGMMFIQNQHQENPLIHSIEATIGALVITFSVISLGEPIRACRFVNIPLGLIFAFMAIYSESMGVLYHLSVALILITLAIPKGKIHASYGKWNHLIT